LKLSDSQGASLGFNSEATLTIVDDDSVKIRFSSPQSFFGALSRLPRFEVPENQSSAVIEVVLSASSSQPVRVDYTAVDIGAVAGEDYNLANGTLVFDPGQERRLINVAIIDDAVAESDEVLIIALSNPIGAIIDTPDAELVIEDND
jgi:hypothetical protein